MDVSVVICTWNRARSLDRTLTALHRLRIPDACQWELLVVDNNCTDATGAVLERHAGVLPLVQLTERRPGLSHARNAALREVKGRYVLWTDDDVVVDEGWLAAYVAAFRRWPAASVFGGRILPAFEVPPPTWLAQNLDWLGNCYALRDFGDAERILGPKENPFGANMAFSAEALGSEPFDPALGRREGLLRGGEETAVINRLRSAGAEVVWVPASRLRHALPAERLTLAYIREYHRGQGLTRPRVAPRAFDALRRWLHWLRLEVRWLVQRATGRDPRTWLATMVAASQVHGQLMAASVQRHAR